MIRIGIIDNYDSFTFNLAQLIGSMSGEDSILVWRNDAIDLDDLEQAELTHLIISPGPGTPADSGISIPAIRHFAGRLPILGVCMGHQCIAAAWGGHIVRAPRLMHGKTSEIHHNGRGIFAGVHNPFTAARYHSLIVDLSTVPPEIEMTAWTSEGEPMALAHRHMPIFGVQFHPESFMTSFGARLIGSFLAELASEPTACPTGTSLSSF